MNKQSDQVQGPQATPSPLGRVGVGLHRQILRIAIPSIVTNITVPLLGMVDLAIAGHIGSASVIGAISVGGLIFNMVYWLFNFLRMGTSGITAQAYGRQDVFAIRDALRISVSVALFFGIVIFALQRPIEWFAHLIVQPSDEVWALAVAYFRIRIWAAPAVLALFALNGWFVGMQNSRYPMYIAIGQNLLNIAASALLVFRFDMGIEGVALGTVISQYVGVIAGGIAAPLLCPAPLLSPQRGDDGPPQSPQKGEDKPRQNIFVRLLHTFQSFPLLGNKKGASFSLFGNKKGAGGAGDLMGAYLYIFLRMICLIAVTTAFTSFGAQQGDVLLAVNTLLIQLFILFSYFCDGFALAGEALVGKYVGAQDHRQKMQSVGRLFLWAGGVVLLFTLIYWVGGSGILGILTDDADVIAASAPYLPWSLLVPVTGFAAFMWDGIFVGANAARQMLYALALGSLVFFGVWFMPLPLPANHHLWLAFILYLVTRSVSQSVMARRVLGA